MFLLFFSFHVHVYFVFLFAFASASLYFKCKIGLSRDQTDVNLKDLLLHVDRLFYFIVFVLCVYLCTCLPISVSPFTYSAFTKRVDNQLCVFLVLLIMCMLWLSKKTYKGIKWRQCIKCIKCWVAYKRKKNIKWRCTFKKGKQQLEWPFFGFSRSKERLLNAVFTVLPLGTFGSSSLVSCSFKMKKKTT